MKEKYILFIESNTTTGEEFFSKAFKLNVVPILITSGRMKYKFLKNLKDIKIIYGDTQNINEIIGICKSIGLINIAGILSTSEYYIEISNLVCKKLGLPSENIEIIKFCRNKYLQRKLLKENSISIPKFVYISSIDMFNRIDISYPCIIKPIFGSGSIGVKLCKNYDEAKEHINLLLKLTKNERGITIQSFVLVEEFIEGNEYSVEIISNKIIGITKKYVNKNNFVEIGHDFPANIIEKDKNSIINIINRCNKILGFNKNPLHIELKVLDNIPYIIEINPRLAGGFIPHLINASFGIDLIIDVLKISMGENLYIKENIQKKYSSIRFFLTESSGILKKIHNLEKIKMYKNIISVKQYYHDNEYIKVRNDFRDRIGHIISCNENYESTIESVNKALESVKLEIE